MPPPGALDFGNRRPDSAKSIDAAAKGIKIHAMESRIEAASTKTNFVYERARRVLLSTGAVRVAARSGSLALKT